MFLIYMKTRVTVCFCRRCKGDVHWTDWPCIRVKYPLWSVNYCVCCSVPTLAGCSSGYSCRVRGENVWIVSRAQLKIKCWLDQFSPVDTKTTQNCFTDLRTYHRVSQTQGWCLNLTPTLTLLSLLSNTVKTKLETCDWTLLRAHYK